MAPSTLNGGFPGGSDGKEPGCNAETQVRSLGQEDLLEKGITPTPVFLPGDSMERGGWRTAVHRVVESATAEWLSTLNTQTTLIYSLSTLCPTYTSSCHIQWGCPGSCEGLPEVLNLQKKKKRKFSSYPISPTCQCFQLWLLSDPRRAQVRRCSKSNARLRRRLENNCNILLIISLSKGQRHRNKFRTY